MYKWNYTFRDFFQSAVNTVDNVDDIMLVSCNSIRFVGPCNKYNFCLYSNTLLNYRYQNVPFVFWMVPLIVANYRYYGDQLVAL